MVTRFAANLFAFASLWALITEGRAESWVVGGPVVVAAAATAVSLARSRGWRWSFMGFVRFAPYFMHSSFLGGIDVAWRSLHARLPIHPQLVDYGLHLPDGTARVFFMNAVNLLPGTVTSDLRNEVLTVHVIDGRQPIRQRLEKLEQAVATLFATPIETSRQEGESPA